MTNGFDAAWLESYKKKRASMDVAQKMPAVIEFEIPLLLKLPNTMSGKHWSIHMEQRRKLAPFVETALTPYFGLEPMEKACVTISRYSIGAIRPDWDNLFASAKPLIDLLLVRSKKHPHSFGIIVDDSPERLKPYMFAERCEKRPQQRTVVKIERR